MRETDSQPTIQGSQGPNKKEVKMRDPKPTDDREMTTREREPKICMLEWMEIITQGVFPSEQRLEYMLDHIEGTP